MKRFSQDKQQEIKHGREILEDAEFFWGWGTTAGKLRAQRRACMIISEIRKRGFSNVLEVGSGTGLFTEFFLKAGLNVKGIDISEGLLKKAKNRCPCPDFSLSAADAECMPFKDASFDAVIGVCVLHHINAASALKEIKRVVKKGGIIIFCEPNMMNPQLMLQKNILPIKRMAILGETEDETAFFRWQLGAALRDLGFKEIIIRPFDFLHPWTPRLLISSVRRIGSYIESLPLLREIAGSLFIRAIK